jgi:hypothetical protein
VDASDLPDFSGKVVIFYVSNPPAGIDGGVVLEFVEFRLYGGKHYLIGRVPERVESAWVSRLQAGIAWDSVLHYLMFDSREDYERRTSSAKPGLLRRLLGRVAG